MLCIVSTNKTDINTDAFGVSPDDLRALKAAFGIVVARHRKHAGIEQSVFARMVGMSNSHLREIESGGGNPMLTTQHRIAAALGTSADVLTAEALAKAFGTGK